MSHDEHNPTAYDDLSQVTQTVDFAYAEVDEHVFGVATSEPTLPQLMAEATELTCECQRRVWMWVYQDGAKDLDGFLCRCIIATWVFVPTLAHAYSMTGIASRFGKKKQSIERWTKDFKREFPTIAAHHPHLKHS